MVCAEPLKLGTSFVWKKKRNEKLPQLKEVEDMAYFVPFSKNLKNLLFNEEVRKNIENVNQEEVDLLKTVLNGSYYKENEFFRTNPKSLAIILYYDELGIANPLGSNSTKEKLSMFYWTLANINPQLQSTQNAVQLLGIAKTKLLKKYGLTQLLQPFIEDIKLLQTDGISIDVNGEEHNFKGSLLFCAGDTPASAFLGGFKESVSANRPCRSCLTNQEDWKLHFHDDYFVPRDAVAHQQHVEAVSEPNVPKNIITFWQRRFGVNSRSPLSEVLDVTQCLPQDAMHLFTEGVTERSTRVLLRYYIVDKELFTLRDLNARIQDFDFGLFKTNKPAVVLREHLEKDSALKQSASEMFALAHTLPFIIGEWITEENYILEPILCHVRMLQILNLCSAYEIHLETTYLLARMIELFIIKFNRLHPGWIVPKFHFIVHLPRYIRMFGPARQQWCFRFERAHIYFKQLVPVVQNFKNMALTLSYRHQARLASQLATYPGTKSKKFLYQGDEITVGETVLFTNLPNMHLFFDFIRYEDRETCQILRCLKIKSYGTVYQSECIILLEF